MDFHFYLNKCTVVIQVLLNWKKKIITSTCYKMEHNVVRQQKGNKETA